MFWINLYIPYEDFSIGFFLRSNTLNRPTECPVVPQNKAIPDTYGWSRNLTEWDRPTVNLNVGNLVPKIREQWGYKKMLDGPSCVSSLLLNRDWCRSYTLPDGLRRSKLDSCLLTPSQPVRLSTPLPWGRSFLLSPLVEPISSFTEIFFSSVVSRVLVNSTVDFSPSVHTDRGLVYVKWWVETRKSIFQFLLNQLWVSSMSVPYLVCNYVSPTTPEHSSCCNKG